MHVEIEDLRRVVKRAEKRGRRVVVGGHSLGGSITTAYATWDFEREAGRASGLSGLVFIDGGSSPTPVTAGAGERVAGTRCERRSPWLTFGGIPAPFAGLFNATGALGALIDPDAPSLGQAWPLLPANLKPPVPATNLAQYGYALDTETSPPGLIAAQAHLGHLAASGDPRGWDQRRRDHADPALRRHVLRAGASKGLDGTAWYHPQRLTIDSGAVAAGNANPAQEILDVHATHGHDLPRKPAHLRLRRGARRPAGARRGDDPGRSSRASRSATLTLVDRHTTYSHNDPNSASPKNDFVKNLVPFLGKIGKRHGHHHSHH